MDRPCLSAESERDIKGLKKTDLDLPGQVLRLPGGFVKATLQVQALKGLL